MKYSNYKLFTVTYGFVSADSEASAVTKEEEMK